MFFLIGVVIVFGSVIGGYMPHGDLAILMQPLELLIIGGGGAVGTFVISNPKNVIFGVGKSFGRVFKGAPHNKAVYVELLTLLYSIFRLAKAKSMLALEPHVDNPHDSALFAESPMFVKNHHAVEFLCDYLRLLTMGADNPHEFEALIDEDIETHHAESEQMAGAVTQMSDGLPAFGIVAAVLGVIITMSHINEPPEVLGALIGGALVGTFLGILLAYGLVGPIGANLKGYSDADSKYYQCIKAGLMAHLQGHAPAVSIEFARKTLFSNERPTFTELEEAVAEAPAA